MIHLSLINTEIDIAFITIKISFYCIINLINKRRKTRSSTTILVEIFISEVL